MSFAPWFPPDFGLRKTKMGLISDGTGFSTNGLDTCGCCGQPEASCCCLRLFLLGLFFRLDLNAPSLGSFTILDRGKSGHSGAPWAMALPQSDLALPRWRHDKLHLLAEVAGLLALLGAQAGVLAVVAGLAPGAADAHDILGRAEPNQLGLKGPGAVLAFALEKKRGQWVALC